MRRLAIVAALAALAAAAPAEAATLINSGGLVTYTATGAGPVDVSIYYGQNGGIYVTPQSAYDRDPLTTVVGCVNIGDSFATYDCDDVTAVSFKGGSGDDTLNAFGLVLPLTADGGAGDDVLTGGEVTDTLIGGAGDDFIRANLGDTVSGGPGRDIATYTAPENQLGPVNITLDGIADDGIVGASANFLADIEEVTADGRSAFPGEPLATYGPVKLVGSPAGNRLTGSSGPDTIIGAGGVDVLEGMGGDDLLDARDGFPDRVRCGWGTDTALVDAVDHVSDTCEIVKVLPATVVEEPEPVVIPDDAPPRIAWRPGTDLGVVAEDDRGVAMVQWRDDDRVLCTDTEAPYDCEFHPRIEDVGNNTLVAIAIDSTGQTASIVTNRAVERFKPIAVSLKVKRSGRRYVASGTVKLPAGTPCSGKVAVGKRQGRLTRSCTFRFAVPRASRYVADYLGTDAIAPARSKAVRRR